METLGWGKEESGHGDRDRVSREKASPGLDKGELGRDRAGSSGRGRRSWGWEAPDPTRPRQP